MSQRKPQSIFGRVFQKAFCSCPTSPDSDFEAKPTEAQHQPSVDIPEPESILTLDVHPHIEANLEAPQTRMDVPIK